MCKVGYMIIEIVKEYTDRNERVFSIGGTWKLPCNEAEELVNLGIAERKDD